MRGDRVGEMRWGDMTGTVFGYSLSCSILLVNKQLLHTPLLNTRGGGYFTRPKAKWYSMERGVQQ